MSELHMHAHYVKCHLLLDQIDRWMDRCHPALSSLSLSLLFSLPFFMSLSLCEADAPEQPGTVHANVGDADVKRHRYLTVTHIAPLYPHRHHQHHCSTLITSLFQLTHYPPSLLTPRPSPPLPSSSQTLHPFFRIPYGHKKILKKEKYVLGHLRQALKDGEKINNNNSNN